MWRLWGLLGLWGFSVSWTDDVYGSGRIGGLLYCSLLLVLFTSGRYILNEWVGQEIHQGTALFLP